MIMIKIDENDPIGEIDPSFPYRDVTIKRNTDMKQFYDLQREIGRGKFGTVYHCIEKSTGLKLAAKFICIAKRQDRRNAEREVEIMRELQHPRLIQMYDAYEINNMMCVVLELIEGGELFERVIDDDFILTEKSVSVFMRQICEGIAFIHSKNILHLDMKPENILCLSRNGNRIKIIDFGLARKYDPEKKLQVLFGTPEFVAPEVVNFDSIGFGTDMWSVGVICYVLLSGLSPFMGETDVQTMANVTIAQYDFDDEAFNDISKDAQDFISKLLVKNREERMSATECLAHCWLQRRNTTRTLCNDADVKLCSELDLQKDVLRNIVDRWNYDTSNVNAAQDKLKIIEFANGMTNGVTDEEKSKSEAEHNVSKGNLIEEAAEEEENRIHDLRNKSKCGCSLVPRKQAKLEKDGRSTLDDLDKSSRRTSSENASKASNVVDATETKGADKMSPKKSKKKKTSGTRKDGSGAKLTASSKTSAQMSKTNPATVGNVNAEKVISSVSGGDKGEMNSNEVGDLKITDVSSRVETEAGKLANLKTEVGIEGTVQCNDVTGAEVHRQLQGTPLRKLENIASNGGECDTVQRSGDGTSAKSTTDKTIGLKDTKQTTSAVEGTSDKGPSQVPLEVKIPTTISSNNKVIIANKEKEVDDAVRMAEVPVDGGGNRIQGTGVTTNPPKTPTKALESPTNSLVHQEPDQQLRPPATQPVAGSSPGDTNAAPKLTTSSTSTKGRTSPKITVNDECYECVKKRNVIIKNIVEEQTSKVRSTTKTMKTTSASTAVPMPSQIDEGRKSEPKTSVKTNDVRPPPVNVFSQVNDFFHTPETMRRRVSDISSVLSSRDRIDRSFEDMTSFCNSLTEIVRLRAAAAVAAAAAATQQNESLLSSSKRPKFRISCFSRDVPFATSPLSNSVDANTSLLSPLHGDESTSTSSNSSPSSSMCSNWPFQTRKSNPYHSDPGSLRNSPERLLTSTPSLTNEILSKFFKNSTAAAKYSFTNLPSPSTSHSIPKDKITQIFS